MSLQSQSVPRTTIVNYLDNLLQPTRFRDYCPNGLQVEGRNEISRIVSGVTASQALLDIAIAKQADAILVHHGWFWKSEDGRVTGYRKQRMASLLAHELNLLAYHLPLDAHPELGNNAQLAARLGWQIDGRFGEQEIGFHGVLPAPTSAGEVARSISTVLGREPQLIGDAVKPVKRIAWCTGGAQSYFEAAFATGADMFVSGEISEQTVHLARETGMPYLAAGHHATERYGVQAVGALLAQVFGIAVEFVDIDNPV
ncbi:MAG: Nif3-like dinuclear metal center hexameric protein [Rhodocyclaceae bacterium]|nr:Nif3-like dinuclear metal center hexameric protein [Rhodocyclaceae bacterium]